MEHSYEQGRQREPAKHVQARQGEDYDLQDTGEDGQKPAIAVDSSHLGRITNACCFAIGEDSTQKQRLKPHPPFLLCATCSQAAGKAKKQIPRGAEARSE
jgi:hypothetical protein